MKEYIFCVDRTKKPTQKRIITSISKDIGTGKVKNCEKDEISDSILWKDFMAINLKMKTSDVFKDKDPPEGEEEEVDASKFKFPWHCEKGIVADAKKLNIEFNEARDLKPVKVFVTGPPASGKTFYSGDINSYYNIPRVCVKELTDQAFKMGKTEEEEGLASEIKAKLDEIRDAAVAKIEEERAEIDYGDQEPPEIDREGLPIRVPDDIIYKLMILRLNENDCRNRGYILDGYPRSYEDCQHIFLKREKKFDEEGNEVEEDEPELEEGQKKSFKGYVKEDSIIPSSTIVFNQVDKFLLDRVKNLSEEQIAGTHYNAADMKRRLKSYKSVNESQVAEPSVQAFFKEHGVQIFERDAAADK
jgi:adenylate kinase